MLEPTIRGRLVTHAMMLLLAATAVACGRDDGPEGGACENPPCGVIDPPDVANPGTMQGFVTDEPGGNAAAPSQGAADYTGSIHGRADMEISTDGGTWYILGEPQRFDISLQDGATAEMTTAGELPPNTYRFVRINFIDVEAVVEAGSVVEGQTLPADVRLRLGDTKNAVTTAEVEGFALENDASAQIILDLNTELWMTGKTLTERQIPKTKFEQAATVTIAPAS